MPERNTRGGGERKEKKRREFKKKLPGREENTWTLVVRLFVIPIFVLKLTEI